MHVGVYLTHGSVETLIEELAGFLYLPLIKDERPVNAIVVGGIPLFDIGNRRACWRLKKLLKVVQIGLCKLGDSAVLVTPGDEVSDGVCRWGSDRLFAINDGLLDRCCIK
jgi:hypothetical protein